MNPLHTWRGGHYRTEVSDWWVPWSSIQMSRFPIVRGRFPNGPISDLLRHLLVWPGRL
jgi:hypothetical protein